MSKLAVMGLTSIVLLGCASEQTTSFPADTPVSVSVAEGKSLEEAVLKAATRRRWTPNKISEGTIRCTLVQRDNRVVVDILLHGNAGYTMHCVECTIPRRKYDQWANNLVREINKWANTQ